MHVPPPLIFFTAGMLSLFGKVHLSISYILAQNEVSIMYGYKATHLANGSHLVFFLHNLVKILAEINEHACIKSAVSSI